MRQGELGVQVMRENVRMGSREFQGPPRPPVDLDRKHTSVRGLPPPPRAIPMVRYDGPTPIVTKITQNGRHPCFPPSGEYTPLRRACTVPNKFCLHRILLSRVPGSIHATKLRCETGNKCRGVLGTPGITSGPHSAAGARGPFPDTFFPVMFIKPLLLRPHPWVDGRGRV